MSLKSSFGLLCVILVFTATKGQQQQKTVNTTSTGTDTLLASLKALIPNFEEARLDKDIIAESCPQLWDPVKRKEFNSSAGFLGSLQEIDNFCEQEQPICGFAKWMSNYLCNASQGLQDVLDVFPSPPPFKDFSNLQNVSRLCGELGSKDLKDSITNAIKAANKPNALKLVSFFDELHNALTSNCMKSCSGKNLRACQVVLQGLRTIGTWEELKQKLMLEVNNKAVDVPAATARPVNNTSVPLAILSSNITEIVKPKNETDETTTVQETTPTTTKATTVSVNSNSTTTTTTTTIAAVELPNEGEEDIPVAESPLDENVEELRPDQNVDDKEEVYEDQDDAEKGMDEDVIIDEKKTTQGDLNTMNEQGAKMPKNPYSEEPEDTHFIVYFLVCLVLIVLGYVLYHRRTRVVALIIEGRRGGSSGRKRQGSVRGRPSSSASYKRLDNNLEEVVTSSRAVKSSNVIY